MQEGRIVRERKSDNSVDIPVLILWNFPVILDMSLVFYSSVRSMKPLFFFLFVALTVAVHADPYAFPPEKPMAIPKPLAPLLPFPEEVQAPATVRGQTRSVDKLAEVLESPLPLAQGAVEEGTIEPKLIDTIDSSESDPDILGHNLTQGGSVGLGTKSSDPLGDGVLLTVMVITTIGLVYMAFVAYDYRQRWMQSLTTQNDRYLGGTFDFDTEETFGSPSAFPEGFGLPRRSSI